MKILLVDATFYKKKIDNDLKKLKEQYFKIKKHIQDKYLGIIDDSNTRIFSQGLLRIATLMKRAGEDIEFISLEDLQDENLLIRKKIRAGYFDKICFSAVTPTVPACATFAEYEQINGVQSEFFIGGPHVNEAARETQKRYPIFEGKCVSAFEKDAVDTILGYETPESIIYGDYVDFTILPHPLQEYEINNLFTALGCSYNCKYCADGRMPRVDNSLTGGYENIYPLLGNKRRLIHFFDSNLGHDKNRLFQVCNALKEVKNDDNIFSCNMRPELIDEETCTALLSAGFRDVMIGIESVDELVLKSNNKGITLSDLESKLKLLKEMGFFTTAYTLVGMPSTSKKTFERTVKMCKYFIGERLITDCKVPAIYVPYPRDNFDYLAELGVEINPKANWSDYDRKSFPVFNLRSSNEIITAEEIWEANLNIHREIISAMCQREGVNIENIRKPLNYHTSNLYGIVGDGYEEH